MAKRPARNKKKPVASDPVVELSGASAAADNEPKRTSLPLPNAVLIHICTFAHPRDVLHLSRVSKTLRAELVSRASAYGWKQAFRNIGMPDLPVDLSGHRYAALAFEPTCDNCYKRCKVLKDTVWDLRVRICTKCRFKPHIFDRYRVEIPAVGLAAIQAHAREMEDWNEKAECKAQVSDVLEQRAADICQRLEREGWGVNLGRTKPYILKHPLVLQPKELFDDDWKVIKPRLMSAALAHWNAKRRSAFRRRARVERYCRWVMATSELEGLIKSTGNDDEVWPDPNDLRRMPELQPMLNGQGQESEAAGQHTPASQQEHVALGSDHSGEPNDTDEGDSDTDDAISNDDDCVDKDSIFAASLDESDLAMTNDRDAGELRDVQHHHSHTSLDADSDCTWCKAEEPSVKQAMRQVFPIALHNWRQRISLQLFDIVPEEVVQASGVDVTSDEAKLAFLLRATVMFRCEGAHELYGLYTLCGGNDGPTDIVMFPDALNHRQSITSALDRFEMMERRISLGDEYWQDDLRAVWSTDNLTYDETASECVGPLLVQCGLEASTATHQDMDTVDARFVCTTCIEEKPDALIVDWRGVIAEQFPASYTKGHGRSHDPCWVRLESGAEDRVRALAPRPERRSGRTTHDVEAKATDPGSDNDSDDKDDPDAENDLDETPGFDVTPGPDSLHNNRDSSAQGNQPRAVRLSELGGSVETLVKKD